MIWESLDGREEEEEVEEAAAHTWYHPQSCVHYFDLVRQDSTEERVKGGLFCLQASIMLGKMVDSDCPGNMSFQLLRLYLNSVRRMQNPSAQPQPNDWKLGPVISLCQTVYNKAPSNHCLLEDGDYLQLLILLAARVSCTSEAVTPAFRNMLR